MPLTDTQLKAWVDAPAFPSEQGQHQDGRWNQTYNSGMTTREYFAAMALQGLLSRGTSATSVELAQVHRFADTAVVAAEALISRLAITDK